MLVRFEKKRYLTQVPLRAARIMSGSTVEKAALYAGIAVNDLHTYEKNPTETPMGVALKLVELYGFSIDDVSFEIQSICFER